MQFRSTRGAPERVDFSSALLRGLAPDGGFTYRSNGRFSGWLISTVPCRCPKSASD
jgi:threonine synthase